MFYKRGSINDTCQKDCVANLLEKCHIYGCRYEKIHFMGRQYIMAQPIYRTVIYTRNREKNCQLPACQEMMDNVKQYHIDVFFPKE